MAFYQKVSEQGIIFFLDNLEDFLSFTKKWSVCIPIKKKKILLPAIDAAKFLTQVTHSKLRICLNINTYIWKWAEFL